MMKLYRPKSNWMDDERLHVPSIDVFEREAGWVKSGLLDHNGNELMSKERTETIGFVTFAAKD